VRFLRHNVLILHLLEPVRVIGDATRRLGFVKIPSSPDL
jgi:hypothetical protein